MDQNYIYDLRQKYIKNPPEGMPPTLIRNMPVSSGHVSFQGSPEGELSFNTKKTGRDRNSDISS